MKTAPLRLIVQAAKIPKGSDKPDKNLVGKLTRAQALDIARIKMQDLNAYDEEAAVAMVAGTARSMGVTIVD
jgi:large subunit ribosomal protein L11